MSQVGMPISEIRSRVEEAVESAALHYLDKRSADEIFSLVAALSNAFIGIIDDNNKRITEALNRQN